MLVSQNVPLDVDKLIEELYCRMQLPWNNGRINDYNEFQNLQRLFAIMNSGIPQEDFFYCGNIFRLHTAYVSTLDYIDKEKERIISKIYEDGSCLVLPITEFSDKLVAYSKSPDFTNHKIFYKVTPNQKAVLLHSNTQGAYGIDVNQFLQRYGIITRYESEQEVLFPLEEKYLTKEYHGTPNKFRYYLRGYNK